PSCAPAPPPPRSAPFPYTTLFRSAGLEPHLQVDFHAGGQPVRPLLLHAGEHALVEVALLREHVHRPVPVDEAIGHHVAHVVAARSEEHTSELQSRENLVCRLLLEK